MKGDGGVGPVWPQKPSQSKYKCPLFIVKVNTAKDALSQRGRIWNEQGSGQSVIHFPKHPDFGETYFAQYGAEHRLVDGSWEKKAGHDRNEPWDVAVYNYAALCAATTLGFDIQWNQGVLDPVTIVAPDGLICTAQFPAPVGSATVETIWSVSNAVMAALNKLLAASPKYRYRAQCISDGCMATFNLGGVNQYGEPFGLHLMDPLAAGSGAFATKEGIDAGGPITSPVSCIADVEKNEQAVPLFYLHRKLTPDTGGAGKYRGGLSGEVALTLGGIDKAMALVMTHGAEVPNTAGLAGGWPGSTVVQRMGRGAI